MALNGRIKNRLGSNNSNGSKSFGSGHFRRDGPTAMKVRDARQVINSKQNKRIVKTANGLVTNKKVASITTAQLKNRQLQQTAYRPKLIGARPTSHKVGAVIRKSSVINNNPILQNYIFRSLQCSATMNTFSAASSRVLSTLSMSPPRLTTTAFDDNNRNSYNCLLASSGVIFSSSTNTSPSFTKSPSQHRSTGSTLLSSLCRQKSPLAFIIVNFFLPMDPMSGDGELDEHGSKEAATTTAIPVDQDDIANGNIPTAGVKIVVDSSIPSHKATKGRSAIRVSENNNDVTLEEEMLIPVGDKTDKSPSNVPNITPPMNYAAALSKGSSGKSPNGEMDAVRRALTDEDDEYEIRRDKFSPVDDDSASSESYLTGNEAEGNDSNTKLDCAKQEVLVPQEGQPVRDKSPGQQQVQKSTFAPFAIDMEAIRNHPVVVENLIELEEQRRLRELQHADMNGSRGIDSSENEIMGSHLVDHDTEDSDRKSIGEKRSGHWSSEDEEGENKEINEGDKKASGRPLKKRAVMKTAGSTSEEPRDLEDQQSGVDPAESDEPDDYEFPPTVKILTAPNGSTLYLIGTGHFSKESQNDVRSVIKKVLPSKVIVELCKQRMHVLTLDEQRLLSEASNMSLQTVRETIRKMGAMQGAMFLLLMQMSVQVTKTLHMAPGGEFRVAYQEAHRLRSCKVFLGDRELSVTLKRAWACLGVWQRIQFIYSLITSRYDDISPEEVEKCKEKDMLEQLLSEMSADFPDLSRVLLKERDLYLCRSVYDVTMAGPSASNVVAVVGIGHQKGIEENWESAHLINQFELTRIPQATLGVRLTAKVCRVLFWGGVGFVVYKLVVPGSVKSAITSGDVLKNSLNRFGSGVARLSRNFIGGTLSASSV